MKNIQLSTLLFGIILLFASCEKKQSGFKIKGNVNGFTENSKVVLSDGASAKILDSTRIRNGQFQLNGFLETSPSSLSLVITSNENNESNYSFIFIGNEKVSIVGNKKNFANTVKIFGSIHQEYKTELDSAINPLNKQRNERLQIMFALRNEGKWNDSLQTAYWSKNGIIRHIDKEISKKTEKFITENINSYYALSQLVITKNEYSKDFIQEQLNKLKPEFKETEYVKVLKTFIENKALEIGDTFYDFKAENQNSEIINFSNYFKNNNKYVLLEFYSPHCSWCVKALPKIKVLSKSEKNNLEVVTLNVDKNKEDWLKQYKLNKMNWTSIWNEKGRYSDAYTKYKISMTPSYYLFDNKGKVVQIYQGYDENMTNDISQRIK